MAAGRRMPKQWVTFGSPDCAPGAKTLIWTVRSTIDNDIIGEVRWFAHWRRYCFFPLPNKILDAECLTQIAARLEVETQGQKETWKGAKRGNV